MLSGQNRYPVQFFMYDQHRNKSFLFELGNERFYRTSVVKSLMM